MAALSYAHGASDVSLLGETIGENFRRTVEKFGEREALVVLTASDVGHCPLTGPLPAQVAHQQPVVAVHVRPEVIP